jgi:hypothetical protein
MKLTYRTKVFRLLPYNNTDKDKVHVLIFHPSNEVYENYIAFVNEDVYQRNIEADNKIPKWVAFRQKKL